MKRYKILFRKTFESDYPSEYEEHFYPEELDEQDLFFRFNELHLRFLEEFENDIMSKMMDDEMFRANLFGSLSIEDWDEDGEYETVENLASVKYTEKAIFYNYYPDMVD